VLKTSVAKGDEPRKVFINVCQVCLERSFLLFILLIPVGWQSKEIEQPKFVRATQDGRSGATWSLPHSTAPHREDLDKGARWMHGNGNLSAQWC
jgi:hypothetical protein